MESSIKSWILEKLSIPLVEFNHLPACPFAKEALIKDKILIKELNIENLNTYSVKEHFISELEKYSYHWPDSKEVVVLGCDPKLISSEDLTDVVKIASANFLERRDYIALEDHPNEIEEVSGFVVNQGSYALILLQSAEKLNKARSILKLKNYYKNWSLDYYNEVLSL